MKNGDTYSKAIALTKFVSKLSNFDIISGGETRDWIFSMPVANLLEIPHVMLYKDGKKVGAEMDGRRVLHIADLNNEGSSVERYWTPIIQSSNGKLEDVLFFVDRMEDGVQVMKRLGLRSLSVVKLNEIAWDYQLKNGVVTPTAYRNLRERLENKGIWARKMLRTNEGIDRLVELFDNPKSREKVKGILKKGYPDMKDELIHVLKNGSRSGIDVDEWYIGI